MAYKVIASEQAASDLDSIVGYLVSTLGQPSSARDLLDAYDEVVENLSAYPEMYPRVIDPRLERMGYRKALLKKYVVLYRVQGDSVLLARVFHQSQDYAKLV